MIVEPSVVQVASVVEVVSVCPLEGITSSEIISLHTEQLVIVEPSVVQVGSIVSVTGE